MDGNYDQFADQGTELKAMLNRQNLVENVISDKKLALFQRSHDKAIQRLQYKPWKVGQDVFVYVDKPPVGTIAKQNIPWNGPFPIVKINDMSIVINKKGENVSVNKTKCVIVSEMNIPYRNALGRDTGDEPLDIKVQEKLVKAKVAELTKRILAKKKDQKQAPPMPETVEEPDVLQDIKEIQALQRKIDKLSQKEPFQKTVFTASDIKEGMICVVFAMKATRLAKIMNVHTVAGDPIPWVRVQLLVRNSENKQQFRFVWLDERKRDAYQKKNKHYQEFWVDLYPKDIFYILKFPMVDGKLDQRDHNQIEATWGRNLAILLVRGGGPSTRELRGD